VQVHVFETWCKMKSAGVVRYQLGSAFLVYIHSSHYLNRVLIPYSHISWRWIYLCGISLCMHIIAL